MLGFTNDDNDADGHGTRDGAKRMAIDLDADEPETQVEETQVSDFVFEMYSTTSFFQLFPCGSPKSFVFKIGKIKLCQ